jgi:2-desacetyl-2-hydroxyethyl bacteriochlorophyllide A dehydrogenase
MTRTAKVVTLTGPRKVEVREEEVGEPAGGDVLIRNLYSGISAGTEMKVYRGDAPQWSEHRDEASGLFRATDAPDFAYPLVYGYVAVGHVAQVGAGVDRVDAGDLVFSPTPHRSLTITKAENVVELSRVRDPVHGVLTANLNTALNGVLDAHPAFGDVVVVSGLGVIGLLVVQILSRCGVRPLIAVDRLAHRRALAKQFGADVTLDPSDGVAETVRGITENRGADIVVEVSGASSALQEAIRTAGRDARVIALSWYGGSFENLRLSDEFHHNRVHVISSQVGAIKPRLGPLWSKARRQELVDQLLAELNLAPLFTHSFTVERAADAYQTVDELAPNLVQCVLEYGPA